MKMGRRAVLGWLSASPLAVKAAADEAIGRASGITVSGIGNNGLTGLTPLAHGAGGASVVEGMSWEQQRLSLLDLYRRGAVPEWQVEEFRRRAQAVYHLDPDIASKRSWSMAVKVMTQRERNFQQILDGPRRSAEHSGLVAGFRRVFGFYPDG